jgi:hypothetical protein
MQIISGTLRDPYSGHCCPALSATTERRSAWQKSPGSPAGAYRWVERNPGLFALFPELSCVDEALVAR